MGHFRLFFFLFPFLTYTLLWIEVKLYSMLWRHIATLVPYAAVGVRDPVYNVFFSPLRVSVYSHTVRIYTSITNPPSIPKLPDGCSSSSTRAAPIVGLDKAPIE